MLNKAGKGNQPIVLDIKQAEQFLGLLDKSKQIACSGCGTKQDQIPFKCCSRCKTSIYCSSECQAKHWPEHKKECKERNHKK